MSSDIAIEATDLGKYYKIGFSSKHQDSLGDLITKGFKALRGGREAKPDPSFWALRNASFTIRRGENVGLIGLNGAGKSTLLKILSRITTPTTGQARIEGRVGALLEVGTGFSGELSGRENIFLYGSILGMRQEEIRRKFDAIAEFADIGALLDTPVKRYSSGMYVRLAFAVAAHLDPDILFLDEVLAVGDLAFQRKCLNFARDLQARDSTILLVSHNMFSIKTMCDRVIYLKKGQIVFDGKVEEGIEIYENDSRLTSVGKTEGGRTDTPILVTDFELLDSQSQPKTVFEFGERLHIRLKFQAQELLEQPNFIVSIVRADGVPCCSFSTEVDGFETGSVGSHGWLELITPPMKLVSEMYTLQVTVRQKSFQDVLCHQVATTFHIRHPLLNTHFGVFNEPATWRMELDQAAKRRA